MDIKKQINLNKKFIIAMILVNVIALGLYYSYALFTANVIKDGVVVLKTTSINVTTTATGTGVSNNSFTLASNETKTVTINLASDASGEIGYKMYYTSPSTFTGEVTSNIAFDTGIVEGTMTTSKTFTLTFKNTGSESITLTLGTNGGLKQYIVPLINTQQEILIKVNVMKNIYTDSNWSSIRANITSVEFNTDNTVSANAVTSFDVTDSTSLNPVTLYTIDDGLGTSTYKAVITSNDTIYAPSDGTSMFSNMDKLATFDSTNFKVDRLTSLYAFFANDYELSGISTLATWDTSNVTDMHTMFYYTSLTNLDALTNWDVSSSTDMESMFANNVSLTDASAINDWNINSSATFTQMFYNTPVHPTFSAVVGTWDANGTFTPSSS